MRVLFLTLYPESAASPRYRVHQYLPALRARGWTCDVACAIEADFWRRYHGGEGSLRPRDYLLHELARRRAQLDTARTYDVVVLQKAIASVYWRGLTRLLEPVREKLIYDIDDAVHLAAPDRLPRSLRLLESKRQIDRVARMARVTLAGNAWLADEMRTRGANAAYLPTVVDTDRFGPEPQPDDVYRLGWTGSPSTAAYLKQIEAPVRSSGVGCLVIGAERDAVPLDAEYVPWSQEDERAQLCRCSVGLMPLPATDWAEGKCALKALLFQACGRPVIATPTTAAEAAVTHEVTGFLAMQPADWSEAIEALRDPALRVRMGEAARAHIEAEFSLRVWAPRLAEAIEAAA